MPCCSHFDSSPYTNLPTQAFGHLDLVTNQNVKPNQRRHDDPAKKNQTSSHSYTASSYRPASESALSIRE